MGRLACACVVVWSLSSPAVASDCTRTALGLVPAAYARSEAHEAEGIRAAAEIVPRLSDGTLSPIGRVVMIGIGMSNATQVNQEVKRGFKAATWDLKTFVHVDGAREGRTADAWADPLDGQDAWSRLASRLANVNLSALQVQAAHVVMTQAFPESNGAMTEAQVRQIIDNLLARYPNVRIVYLSGISYTGYSTEARAPEPYVHGDSLLLASLAGTLPVWSDFYDQWSDGITTHPSTGYTWACSDVISDGVHPSAAGRLTLAARLLARWRTDPVTSGWMR